MPEEIFDLCDGDDNVIGQAPRSFVHAKGLFHRAVHIWLWNSRGELLIHRRSLLKDEYPGCWTSSASGHVDAGEDYETAAHRELREELQLSGSLAYQCYVPASKETANEHTRLYFLRTDAPPTPDPLEIAEILYLPPKAIGAMLQEQPERFTPPFKVLFEYWRSTLNSAGS
jgi:16S rRNA (adenine1518-N6/adenine1519-N6)-dimethyltransferase